MNVNAVSPQRDPDLEFGIFISLRNIHSHTENHLGNVSSSATFERIYGEYLSTIPAQNAQAWCVIIICICDSDL
jgi:hypothetical protein